MVDQIADLFRTTQKVKTQQVIKSWGQHCGDIELVGYLANVSGPVPVVLDLRIWISVSDTGALLTLVLMDIYVIGNIALTTTITLLTLYHLYLLLLVRLGGYIVNLSDFNSYRLIGKLTAFFELQEFSLRKPTVTSSTSTARFSLNSSKAGLAWLSLRRQLYVLRLI